MLSLSRSAPTRPSFFCFFSSSGPRLPAPFCQPAEGERERARARARASRFFSCPPAAPRVEGIRPGERDDGAARAARAEGKIGAAKNVNNIGKMEAFSLDAASRLWDARCAFFSRGLRLFYLFLFVFCSRIILVNVTLWRIANELSIGSLTVRSSLWIILARISAHRLTYKN